MNKISAQTMSYFRKFVTTCSMLLSVGKYISCLKLNRWYIYIIMLSTARIIFCQAVKFHTLILNGKCFFLSLHQMFTLGFCCCSFLSHVFLFTLDLSFSKDWWRLITSWYFLANTYRFGLWCLAPLSTIFLLYRGRQFYWWRKPEYPEKTIEQSQVIDNL